MKRMIATVLVALWLAFIDVAGSDPSACPSGTFSATGNGNVEADCDACPSGRFNSVAGATLCTACERGKYSGTTGATNNHTCDFCSVGRFQADGGKRECDPCPVGRLSRDRGAYSISHCFACGAGTYRESLTTTECSVCPKGKYLPSLGSTSASSCVNCPMGKYGEATGLISESACQPCPIGKYSDVNGATSSSSCSFTFVQYGCIVPSGSDYGEAISKTASDGMLTLSSCRSICEARGDPFFGLSCPQSTSTYCQCFSHDRIFSTTSITQSLESCANVAGACTSTSSITQNGATYYLGGQQKSSVYAVSTAGSYILEIPEGIVNYPSNNAEQGVHAADLDNDGDTDIITASSSDGTVRWYENNGASPPSFTPHTISTSVNGAWRVSTGDVDGDGDLDVIVATHYSQYYITYFENDGASPPAWTYRWIYATGVYIVAQSFVDINGDGRLDIISGSRVAGGYYPGTVEWYRNDGGSPPTFTKLQIVTSFSYDAWDVAAADLNSDGHLDIVAIRASGSGYKVEWYKGDPTEPSLFESTSTTISTNPFYPIQMSVGDINGDSYADIVVASYFDSKVHYFENSGGSTPTFTHHVVTSAVSGSSWVGVHIADLDGDGHLDILSSANAGYEIAWYENSGEDPPEFIPHVVSESIAGMTLYAADLDGDGDLELIVSSSSVNVLSSSSHADRVVFYYNRRIQSTLRLAPLDSEINCAILPDSSGHVSIPYGWTKIVDGAFAGCLQLKSVSIPETVTSIGRMAFFECKSLRSVQMSNGVESIGKSAFAGCSAVESMSIPSSVTSVGCGAFYEVVIDSNSGNGDADSLGWQPIGRAGDPAFDIHPSGQPTSQPSIPTGVPTSAPTRVIILEFPGHGTMTWDSSSLACSNIGGTLVPRDELVAHLGSPLSNDRWTPVSDSTNSWMQAGIWGGSESNFGKTHTELGGSTPSWGQTSTYSVNRDTPFYCKVTGVEAPSSQPSGQPSGRPSSQPSVQPSCQPSGQPTTQPSSQPTAQPSSEPSSQPTTQPTSEPSSQPTAEPTTEPTTQPTTQPTAQPTTLPTALPTTQPTAQPTTQPTSSPTLIGWYISFGCPEKTTSNFLHCTKFCSSTGTLNEGRQRLRSTSGWREKVTNKKRRCCFDIPTGVQCISYAGTGGNKGTSYVKSSSWCSSRSESGVAGRLCTAAEYDSGICCGTGQNVDDRLVWTSDTCTSTYSNADCALGSP